MTRIGLFGRKNDPHILAIEAAVRKAGGVPVVVDFHNFPRFNLVEMGSRLRFDDIHLPGVIDLDTLDAACLRTTCFTWPTLPAAGSRRKEQAGGAKDLERERTRMTRQVRGEVVRIAVQTALMRVLARRIPVVNPPDAVRHHRQKARQHQLLRRHGIPTPAAVTTNDPARIHAFLREHEGRVVVKPQASGAEVVMADAAFLEANAEVLEARPFLFQQFVSGRSFRCYVVGGRVVSMGEILHDRRHVDWRERSRGAVPVTPSSSLEALVRKAVQLLDLPFCAIDLEEDAPTGRVYFLDFNPSALFTFWSRTLEVDIAGHLADYLVALGRGKREKGFAFADPGT